MVARVKRKDAVTAFVEVLQSLKLRKGEAESKENKEGKAFRENWFRNY